DRGMDVARSPPFWRPGGRTTRTRAGHYRDAQVGEQADSSRVSHRPPDYGNAGIREGFPFAPGGDRRRGGEATETAEHRRSPPAAAREVAAIARGPRAASGPPGRVAGPILSLWRSPWTTRTVNVPRER